MAGSRNSGTRCNVNAVRNGNANTYRKRRSGTGISKAHCLTYLSLFISICYNHIIELLLIHKRTENKYVYMFEVVMGIKKNGISQVSSTYLHVKEHYFSV